MAVVNMLYSHSCDIYLYVGYVSVSSEPVILAQAELLLHSLEVFPE